MKTNITTEEQESIVNSLKNQNEFLSINELVEKTGQPVSSVKAVGKWLASEARTLGLEIEKRYGVNHYRYRPHKINNSSPEVFGEVMKEFLTELRTNGIDVDTVLDKIKTRKARELAFVEKLF